MPIEFRSDKKILEVKTNQGELMKYEIEFRYDPLTNHVSILCPHLEDKWARFYYSESKEWFDRTIEASRKQCIFCMSLIDNMIAKFPEVQMPKEVYKNGYVYIFPNLYPRTSFEAIVTNPHLHVLDFSIDLSNYFYDLISSAIDCMNEAYVKNPDLRYAVIGCNYLPPAGASLMHFHMQISMQEIAFYKLKVLMEKSNSYYEHHKSSYWKDLLNEDKDRMIAAEGNVYWYVPFAPTGFSEIRSVIDRIVVTDLNAEDIKNIAIGIYKILSYYGSKGYSSFNFILYSGSLAKEDEDFRCGIQIVARSNYSQNYLSIDSWYMPYLLEQTIILEKPEELAARLRERWQSS